MMDRRDFIRIVAGLGALSLLPLSGCGVADKNAQPLLLSGSDNGNRHTLSGWRLGRGESFRIEVAQRVHAPLMHPNGQQAIFVARRPGTSIYVVDINEGRIQQEVAALPDRHFYGHATFSNDGRWLYVAENAYLEQGLGKIAVYDAKASYQRVREFDLQGIGPHQLALMPDGHTLVIALGGIQTHPHFSRDKLNLDTMQSELVFLDTRNGMIQQRFAAPHQHLSLRHLDVSAAGDVMVGAQFQTKANPDFNYQGPLVFLQRGNGGLEALQAPQQTWLSQQQYIASVVFSDDGSLAVTTSPRGGVVNLWKVDDGTLLRQFEVADVAGAGYLTQQASFVVSNGLGQLFSVGRELSLLAESPKTRWDNHLFLV